ncbi:MAG: cytochrome C, partial [Deltaproteobacteria bacterium]
AAALLIPVLRGGFSAHDEPSRIEALVARRLRLLSIPASARERANRITTTTDVLRDAREHFGDHCAICHAPDGGGQTAIGENLFPKPPDMRKEETQSLTDGEIFFIIRNGVRYTGMPAWGSGDPERDDDSWKLVDLIRQLPNLGEAEIAEIRRAMPKGADEESGHHHTHGSAAAPGSAGDHGEEEHHGEEHHGAQ